MDPSSENLPIDHPHGLWTLVTTSISLVLLLIGGFLIQPRLTERRIRIDDQFILTPTEAGNLRRIGIGPSRPSTSSLESAAHFSWRAVSL